MSAARCLLLALNVLLLSSPGLLVPWIGVRRAFLVATILLTIVNAALVLGWDRRNRPANDSPSRDGRAPIAAAVAATIGALILFLAARAWVHQILIYPVDAGRADMLVVIQLGIRRLFQGGNPYAIYHVPWDVPLPYGPVMWAPLIAPYLLHADVRFVTLAGVVFVPVACAVVAVMEAAHGRRALSASWLIVAATISFSPAITDFVSIGHTPAYWPLIALLAWLVGREQWYGAAVTAGLLIVARTTMVSLAPVVLMAIWYRGRPRFAGAFTLLTAAALVPFLPFAIWDGPALKYALYGSYQNVMKGFVWVSTTWVQDTIGVSGLLLSLGWQRAVEIVQVVVLLAVYAASAAAIRAGRRPLPWMALALLAFSMTSLWPVIYLYFDVCLLLVCAGLSRAAWAQTGSVAVRWTSVLAASMLVVAIAAWSAVPVDAAIDAGTPADRAYLYSGFSSDEREGDITFAWVDGSRAEILIPRRSRRDATIEIVCGPHLPTEDTVQQLSVSLNGTIIGTVTLKGGWQRVKLAAPGHAWQYGVNELTLFLSTAVSPKDSGLGEDTRRLSLALDRLIVRTPP